MAKHNGFHFQQEFNSLKKDVSKLRVDTGELIDKLVDATVSTKDSLLKDGKKAVNNVDKMIEKNPLMGVLSGFGIGVLLGSISKFFISRHK